MSIEEKFVDGSEVNWPKIRGAFRMYVEEVAKNEGVADKRPVFEESKDLISVWVKEFDSWLNRNLDGDWFDWRNGRDLFSDEKEVIHEYYSDNGEIKKLVEDNTVVYKENADEKEIYSELVNGDNGFSVNGTGSSKNGGKDSSGGSGNDSGSGSYSGRFPSIVEVGLMGPDKELNKSKIRGAMKKFAHDVDEVVGTEEEPNYNEAKEAFNRWMMERFDNEWPMFIHEMLEPAELRSMAEVMWERNDEYRETVSRKWIQDKSEFEGNGDSGNGSGGGGKDSITGIGGWADEYGAEEEDGDGEDYGESSGKSSSGNGHHKTDGMRYRQFREEKAHPSEMWDLEDIVNTITRENVWTAMDKMPSNVVDLAVTSPPYWNLRDYDGGEFASMGGEPHCDHKFNDGECYKCGAWRGQLGREPEPSMFVDNIVSIMSKIGRILKPGGSLFLNIGDTYAGQTFNGDINAERKSMLMLPQRIYIQMIENGWTLRQPIMWVKQILFNDDEVHGATNPTSVKDRINHTYEPFFWFTNSPDYYSDIYAVRREAKTDEQDMADYDGKYEEEEIEDEMYNSPTARAAREGYEPSFYHDAGANIPDAWRVPTGNAGKEHPAVFSPELPKRPINMASPRWVCSNCLAPYERVVEDGDSQGFEKQCTCDTDEKRPGIVFDPFCGRGTTAKAAEDEGRDWITTEVSDKYADFAEDYVTGSRKAELSDFMG